MKKKTVTSETEEITIDNKKKKRKKEPLQPAGKVLYNSN